MRKVVLLMHISLDGMVSGPNGEMDWIKVDDEIFSYVAQVTAEADTNLFGRATYQMMEGYWPTAGEQPGASQHDIDHARWYNAAQKIVFTNSLASEGSRGTRMVSGNVADEIARLKQQPGKNMVVIGSPTFATGLMDLGLVDEYWLNVNPVVLGEGKSLFANLRNKIPLKLVSTKVFNSGVVGLRYELVAS